MLMLNIATGFLFMSSSNLSYYRLSLITKLFSINAAKRKVQTKSREVQQADY